MKNRVLATMAVFFVGIFPDQAMAESEEASPEASQVADSGKSPSAEARTEAAERFRRGIEFYESSDYGLALIEFERAYQLVPDYRVLYNVGQVSIQLSRFARARTALARYLKDGAGDLEPARREAVEKDLRMLEARTAFLGVSSNVEGAELLVDDVPWGILPLAQPLLLDAGEHTVVVRKQGYQEKSLRITLAGADRQELSLELVENLVARPETRVATPPTIKEAPPEALAPVPDSQPYNPWLTAGWITTGALAGGAVTAAIMGAASSNQAKSLSEQPNPSTGTFDEQVKRAETRFLVADVLAGAALVTGGTTLFFHFRSRSSEQASLGVGISPQQVLFVGSF